jgi:phosphoserine phosphatase RsbU/P
MEPAPLPGMEELYEAAPCGLLVADAKGYLLRVNATLCRWLGYRQEELVAGVRFPDLLTMGGRIFHQTHLAPLLRMQGSVAEVKVELRRKQGEPLPVMLNMTERAWRDQVLITAAVFVAEDRHKYERELLLQRKRAEELAAQHAKDQEELERRELEAKDRALFAEQMMGIVSHDLRNPLSVIHLGAALLTRAALPPQQLEVVQRVDRAVGRAQRLISDLLDFTQARLGKGLSVRPVQVDLHEVVREAVAELAAAFPEHVIRHDAAGDGTWWADADRVTQAVGNLVANAVAYGAAGEPVVVRTHRKAQHFDVSVHNHGPAIPPELQPRLFDAMVRGAQGSASRSVGLGLYIVREIARAHGGDVQVRSSEHDGTCFSILLPARSTEAPLPGPG